MFVYSAYEKTQIRELKRQLPPLAGGLAALLRRLVDLRPIAERFYYHPSQQGSWSIKDVLPAIRLHDLRHTHATVLLQAGEPVHVVSQRLGHASVVVTLTVYAHVLPGDQRRAAARFAELVEVA